MYKLLKKEELLLTKEKSYKKNDVLYRENEECQFLSIVKKGSVIIKTYDKNGNEIIYKTITENGFFGNNLLFSNNKKYKGDVIAKEDTVIINIEKNNLIKILQNNIDFLKQYLKISADETKEINLKVKMFMMNKVEDRFMYYLKINNNQIEYRTITSLANEINVQRETLSRLISKLIKQKKIQILGNKIIKMN